MAAGYPTSVTVDGLIVEGFHPNEPLDKPSKVYVFVDLGSHFSGMVSRTVNDEGVRADGSVRWLRLTFRPVDVTQESYDEFESGILKALTAVRNEMKKLRPDIEL